MSLIEFHNITLNDRAWMTEKFQEDDRNACEYTFANNFVWRKIYHVEVGESHGCAVIRFVEEDVRMYSYPIGSGDVKAAVEDLITICKEEGHPLIMGPLNEEDRKNMMDWFPGEFLLKGDRNDYDYIYSREKLATLAGKKLHGKRNHIARFKDDDDWAYEELNESNIEECKKMTYSWIQMREDKWNDEMEAEMCVLHEAFDHMKELGLVGGLIRKAGEIVAFSIGEPLNSDTFVVHFEKAFPDMQGAYPMINQQFVLNACEGFSYVNREEDTGDLGLRKAKMSYYPEILLKKYVAFSSDVVFADKEKDGEQIHKIWETCFGDEAELVDFYMKERMNDENMLTIYEDGKAVSMASFLPVKIKHGEEAIDARYVYAVATLPEYQKKGYAAKILEKAVEIYGQPLFLIPAEKTLEDYYGKLGFEKIFPENIILSEKEMPAMRAAELDSYSMEDVSAAEYLKLREHKLMKDGFIIWDEKAIQFAIDFNSYCGGKTVKIIWDLSEGREDQNEKADEDVLMYYPDGEKLLILETTLSTDQLKCLLPELMEQTNTSEIEYSQRSGMAFLPEKHKELKDVLQNGYFSLSLG